MSNPETTAPELPGPRQIYARYEELERAFLRYIQRDNECKFSRNGVACTAVNQCACWLEMMAERKAVRDE